MRATRRLTTVERAGEDAVAGGAFSRTTSGYQPADGCLDRQEEIAAGRIADRQGTLWLPADLDAAIGEDGELPGLGVVRRWGNPGAVEPGRDGHSGPLSPPPVHPTMGPLGTPPPHGPASGRGG